MRRTIAFVLSIIIVLSLLVSCEDSSLPPALEVEVVVLDFLDSSSRALTSFPEDIPFLFIDDGNTGIEEMGNIRYGFLMSCNVMRSIPIFPGLKSVNADANAYVNSVKGKKLKGYGFDIGVELAEKTDDGVFIVYKVFDERGNKTATIEYYYSIKDQKFSYREIVMSLMEDKDGGDLLFVFEMMDVPVTKEGNSFSFKAGEIYGNGSSFTHTTFYNDEYQKKLKGPANSSYPSMESVDKLMFEVSKIAMNYSGEDVYSAEYEKYHSEDYYVSLKDLTGKDSFVIDQATREALDLKVALTFLRSVYEDTFEKHNFSTIEDFDKTELKVKKDKKSVLYKESNETQHSIGFPIAYNLKEKVGACLLYGSVANESDWNTTFSGFTEKYFKICLEKKDIVTFDDFAVAFMEKLGLAQEQIDNRKKILKNSYNLM